MIATHIHHALAQVRELKMRVLNAQRFTGYSGRCRAVGGTLALLAPLLMCATWYPKTPMAHLMGWGFVFFFAVLANYAAVLYWFFFHPDADRDLRKLMPTVDALPSLAVGGIFSLVMVLHGHYDLLFGTWMCLYGLTNLSARQTLPKTLWPLGFFYITCGAICLLAPQIRFTNPWPMGVVFGIGEWIGGLIFHRNRLPDATLVSFFNSGGPNDA
jgi:hypothetical protein